MIGEVTVGTGEIAAITVTLLDADEYTSLPLFDPSLFVSVRAFAVMTSPAFRSLEESPESVHAPLVTVVVPRETVDPRARKTSIEVPFAPLDVPETEVLPAMSGEVTTGTGEVASVTTTAEDVDETTLPEAVA